MHSVSMTFVGDYKRCYHKNRVLNCGAGHDHKVHTESGHAWHWRGKHWHIECMVDQLASELEEHIAEVHGTEYQPRMGDAADEEAL